MVRIYNNLLSEGGSVDAAALSNLYDIRKPIDLIIRTGKRRRLSSCIPLNSPFAEILFLDILFPDFNAEQLDKALQFYSEQIRTYGK